MKMVQRRSRLIVDPERFENDAEHSFHIAAMAVLLKEYAHPGTDMERVLSMLLFHDVVEIEAGDTFAYDDVGNASKEEREQAAADKLFGLLPEDQRAYVRGLWDEFEAQETAESRFALAMDRLEPVYLNAKSGGGTWKDAHVSREAVDRRIAVLKEFPKLYEFTVELVDSFFAGGDQ
ncbi:MAG: HD domain-containing protein [Tissierellia bacterium]|nr:HD domain-containing protein [Tissierellia bacterium]